MCIFSIQISNSWARERRGTTTKSKTIKAGLCECNHFILLVSIVSASNFSLSHHGFVLTVRITKTIDLQINIVFNLPLYYLQKCNATLGVYSLCWYLVCQYMLAQVWKISYIFFFLMTKPGLWACGQMTSGFSCLGNNN